MERALQRTIKRHMKDAVECVSARTAVFVCDVECFCNVTLLSAPCRFGMTLNAIFALALFARVKIRQLVQHRTQRTRLLYASKTQNRLVFVRSRFIHCVNCKRRFLFFYNFCSTISHCNFIIGDFPCCSKFVCRLRRSRINNTVSSNFAYDMTVKHLRSFHNIYFIGKSTIFTWLNR